MTNIKSMEMSKRAEYYRLDQAPVQFLGNEFN